MVMQQQQALMNSGGGLIPADVMEKYQKHWLSKRSMMGEVFGRQTRPDVRQTSPEYRAQHLQLQAIMQLPQTQGPAVGETMQHDGGDDLLTKLKLLKSLKDMEVFDDEAFKRAEQKLIAEAARRAVVDSRREFV